MAIVYGGGMKLFRYMLTGLLAMSALGVPSLADERRFTYTYEPETPPARRLEFESWVNVKSKLKGEEASLLTRYLGAYRAGRLPGKPQDEPKSAPSGAAAR